MEPKRIRIKLPSEQEMKQLLPQPKEKNFLFLALFFLIPALIFAVSLALFMMVPSGPPISHTYELGRFSGTAEIYSSKTHQWTTVTRRSHRQITLGPKDRVRTESDSDLDFRIPEIMDFRLKASSEIEIKNTRKENEIKIKLIKGGLLGVAGNQYEDRSLQVETGRMNTVIRNSSFFIQTGKVYSSVGVLAGEVEVTRNKSKKIIMVKPLENLMVTDYKKQTLEPKRVNYQEWRGLSEVRDLTMVTAEQMAEQLDLRKKAGNFFNYVFDEGVFFKPNWGYAEREFYEEGTEIILRLDYDVFPQGSFSGMYFKTRDLDLSKVKRLRFKVKAHPDKSTPDQIRIELKDQMSTVRGFAVKEITKDWKEYSFDFNATKPTPAGEMVFVFENNRVGAFNTNGTIYLKDIVIE